MNIIKVFEASINKMNEKNWDCIYILVDIHGTIFKPSYGDKETYELYPYAKEALKLMSESEKIKLILWSSTKYAWIMSYMFKLSPDVIFDYINENPEISEGDIVQMSFDKKPYFNIGLDDKFGFEPETDWKAIYEYLRNVL